MRLEGLVFVGVEDGCSMADGVFGQVSQGLEGLVDGSLRCYCSFAIRVLLVSECAGSDAGDLKPSKYCRQS